ncbi:MAG: hypothetical protein ACREJ5_12705 [Geminicoccaceae bacterium]
MALLHPAAGAVVITDDIDEGIACFKVVTESATYFYDKAGAGFTSILDRDGIDWINFRPEGTPGVPNGQWGWFRGIPNMARGVFGHPGYTGALSTTADPKGVPLSMATVRSRKNGWQVTWEFCPSYAQMTALSAPARYWLLYEGTPGGELGDDDLCGRSDGRVASCSIAWQEDVVNTSGVATSMEWVYFADGTLERSLVLLHDDDDVTDCSRRMDGMTVFGFGRAGRSQVAQPSLLWRVVERVGGRLGLTGPSSALLDRVPAGLIIGFVEARDFDRVKAGIDDIYRAATAPGQAGHQA